MNKSTDGWINLIFRQLNRDWMSKCIICFILFSRIQPNLKNASVRLSTTMYFSRLAKANFTNLFENTHSKRQIKFVSLVNITVWLLKQPQLSAFNLISDLIILHVMFHRIPDIHYKHIDSLRVSQMTNSDVKRQNPLLNKGQVRLFILSRDWKESLWDFPHANKIIPSY